MSWCDRVELGDDPCLPHQNLQARNYLIACFAISLIRGETLLARKVRHRTLRHYVKAACKLHTDREMPSPRSANIDYIKTVLDAVGKYERVPSRREMIHDEMIYDMQASRCA